MIPTHFLRRNKSSALPGQCITIHCQPVKLATPPERGYYASVCGAWASIYWQNRRGQQSNRGSCCGDAADAFWYWVNACLSPGRPLWCFAYSMGTTLQLLNYWKRVDDGEFSNRSTYRSEFGAHRDKTTKQHNCITCTDDPPVILKHYRTRDEATVIFLDCANYWPATIDELANCLSHNVMGEPLDSADSQTWRRYCLHQAEIVESAIFTYMTWIRDNELGMFRYTTASQSMAAFRHKFLKHDILVHQNADARSIERAGYYGGQTECYQLGPVKGPLYKLDVCAMYPSVMMQRQYPVKIKGHHIEQKEPISISPCIPLDKSIATVTLAAEQRTYPYRSNNRTQYPIGTYQTTLAGPELVDAYNRGEILQWHAWTSYDTAELFTSFVDSLWKMRMDLLMSGFNWLAACTKWLTNSLYGKFGQRKPKWTEQIGKRGFPRWGRTFIHNARNNAVTTLRHIAGQVYRLDDFEEHPEAVPSIAAFITSYARQKMRSIREVAGPGNVYYQCCDSVLVNQTGYDRLCIACMVKDMELGFLRLDAEYAEVDILGANYLKLDGQWITAGISQRIIDHDGNCWTTEIDNRMDTYLDKPPKDTHIMQIRRHTKNPYQANGRAHPIGKVAPPVIHEPMAREFL